MNREMLFRRINAIQFAMWELHIFLDTHPCDESAIEKYNALNDQRIVLTEQYEERFGPLEPEGGNEARWEWANGPWPWESDFLENSGEAAKD